jgi:hypothetical protein
MTHTVVGVILAAIGLTAGLHLISLALTRHHINRTAKQRPHRNFNASL